MTEEYGSGEMNEEILVLTDEDGNDVEFEYLDTVQWNEREFIVLLPLDQEGDENEVVIFEIVADDEGNEEFMALEDEDTLNAVFAEFQARAEEDEEEE